MRKGKVRTIYSNYDLWNSYASDARKSLVEEGIYTPSENAIWDRINEMDQNNWEDINSELARFFNNGSTWILTGYVTRWTGRYDGGFLFTDYRDILRKAGKDCEDFHFYDINGHFFLQCSHHDGTNLYEIKKVTEKGISYYENWGSSIFSSDQRTEQEILTRIMNRYSTLPHYVHIMYGCPKVEFENQIA